MRIAYLDCFSGASGNMMLGALLDAGIEVQQLEAELAHLPVNGYRLDVQSVQRNGLHGIYVDVQLTEAQPHRHLHDIEEIIRNSPLPDSVQARSLAIFGRLAEAEAHVHGSSPDHVHFHEVGGVDAIVDIVGTALMCHLLGIEQVFASPLHIGSGTVRCAHGTLPVPAPATLELLRGVPIYGRDVDAELVTPTGAAILTGLATDFGDAPPMIVEQIGYGAGSRELPWANLLRISIGQPALLSQTDVRSTPAPGHHHHD